MTKQKKQIQQQIVKYRNKLYWFIKYKIEDIKYSLKHGKTFNEFGLTLYTGKQGSGKTISMVEYLYRMKQKYPECKIYTNFHSTIQDGKMQSWEDILKYKNGEKGVIFALDEIQNEFDNSKWKTFPAWILSEITQQRKQRVKIVGTSQIFTRVVKQLREQCFEVVECKTLFGRYTRLKAYDGQEYDNNVDKERDKRGMMKLWKRSYIQTNEVRGLYDTYEKIENINLQDYMEIRSIK